MYGRSFFAHPHPRVCTSVYLMYDVGADFEQVFLHVAWCIVVVFVIFGICRIPEHSIKVVA